MDELKLKTKVEIYWNELIFSKFNNSITIDKKIIGKNWKFTKWKKREFLISEIVFNKKGNEKLEMLISEIKKSIDEIGFNNTANIYSVSESSKFGGKVDGLILTHYQVKFIKKLKI